MRRGLSAFNMTSVALGLAFLYLPIAILVIYSFNASRLVAVWGGWSTRWYAELLNDQAPPAAISLTRSRRFRRRVLFTGLVYAPLVMPEVITGLALLLLFVAVEVDRG